MPTISLDAAANKSIWRGARVRDRRHRNGRPGGEHAYLGRAHERRKDSEALTGGASSPPK